MFRHLLLPLDGSKLAEAVLGPARAFAKEVGAAVTLLHVLERNAPKEIHGERHLTDPKEAEVYLEGLAADLRQDGLTVSYHSHDVAEAGVAESITRHAVEMGADLVVLATHGEGGMAEQLFGSIAQRVIGCGDIPVLIIHPDTATEDFVCRRMLVPLDQSEEHEASLPLATELAAAVGAEVRLLTAVPRRANLAGSSGALGRMLPTAMSAVLDAQVDDANRRLEAVLAHLADAGVPARARVERGDPVQVILQGLVSEQADLLVLATHTRRGWAAFWSGSVAPRVLAQWRRPTLLVRAASRG